MGRELCIFWRESEIRVWFNISLFCEVLALLLVLIGIITDALNRTLVLESMSWFLLAIFLSLSAAAPLVKSAVAKHLY